MRPAPTPSDELDAALDTVIAILRAMGERAFDVGDKTAGSIRTEFDRWASRISIAAPATEEEGESRSARRDWGGVRRFVTQHRSEEQDYVVRSMENLKAAVETFVNTFAQTVREERRSDTLVAHQLDRLVTAVSEGNTERIRAEVTAAATLVRDTIQKRREREQLTLQSLSDRVRDLKRELVEVRKQATVDPLTQLYNRAAFDEQIERVAALSLLMGAEPCLLMIDVDHFKKVNDDFGHVGGDHALRAVADALVRNFLRKEDFVTRYGGEEFAVIIPDTTVETAVARAERVRVSIAELDLSELGIKRPVTASLGVAFLAPGEAIEAWVHRADQALYEAKRGGRNRTVVARMEGFESVQPAARTPTPVRISGRAERRV